MMYFIVDTTHADARPAVLWLRERGAFNVNRWLDARLHDQSLCYNRYEYVLHEFGTGFNYTVSRFILRNKTLATEFKLTWGM